MVAPSTLIAATSTTIKHLMCVPFPGTFFRRPRWKKLPGTDYKRAPSLFGREEESIFGAAQSPLSPAQYMTTQLVLYALASGTFLEFSSYAPRQKKLLGTD